MKNKQKSKFSKTAIAGLVGAAILMQPIAQNAGCKRYEPRLEDIPQVQAVNEDGIPYVSEKERAKELLQEEKEMYAQDRQNLYTITVLPGDTLEGIAKETYNSPKMQEDVFIWNNSDYAQEIYPRVFNANPELRGKYLFTNESNPDRIYPGQKLLVYISTPKDAAAYAKKHPERKVESLGLKDLQNSTENFLGGR